MHELNIPAMSCGHCVGTVNKAIKAIDPQATIEIDLPTRIVRIQTEKTRQAIAEALIASGYPPG